MMKIDIVEGGYKPITVVLETEEEAKCLWHVLDCMAHRSLDSYTVERSMPKLGSVTGRMWREFSARYSPYNGVIK